MTKSVRAQHRGGDVCVVASSRPWNKHLATRLGARTGIDFRLISDPKDLTSPKLAELAPRYIFFPHWSHIIEADIYKCHPCIIFHMTDLPYGRGGSPLQNLIVRGHKTTKISAIRCVEGLDAGPIYLKRDLTLHGTAEEIFIRADRIIEDMIVTMLTKNTKPRPQKGTPTLFKRRKPAEGDLAQVGSLDAAFDLIRMLDADGYPPAFLEYGPLRLEFKRASRKVDGIIADVRIVWTK